MLVVWNMTCIFPYIGNVIIPMDELIFFRGVDLTTNQQPVINKQFLTPCQVRDSGTSWNPRPGPATLALGSPILESLELFVATDTA